LPILSSTIDFSQPRTQAPFEGPVVDVLLRLELRGSSVVNTWQNEVSRFQDTGGCSQQTVHSLQAQPGDDGQLHCYFHVKHVNRWCVAGATGDNFTVETDVWNDFWFTVSPDRNSFQLSMSGRASDNVSQLARDVAKAIGNLAAAFPLTSSLMLGLDKRVFEGLKAERDALEAASAIRDLYSQGVPDAMRKRAKLDLALDQVFFTRRPPDVGVIVILRTRAENPILVEQAKVIFRKLSQQRAAMGTRGRF